jgi:putative phosphoesterase
MSAELRLFFESLKKEIDYIVHAGDINGIDFLTELKDIFKDRLIVVSGNMDNEGLSGILKNEEVVELEKITIAVTHSYGAPVDAPSNAYNLMKKHNPDIIIFGHSHHALNKINENGVLMFNPGSLLDEVYAPYTSYGMIEINNGEIVSREIKRIKI